MLAVKNLSGDTSSILYVHNMFLVSQHWHLKWTLSRHILNCHFHINFDVEIKKNTKYLADTQCLANGYAISFTTIDTRTARRVVSASVPRTPACVKNDLAVQCVSLFNSLPNSHGNSENGDTAVFNSTLVSIWVTVLTNPVWLV